MRVFINEDIQRIKTAIFCLLKDVVQTEDISGNLYRTRWFIIYKRIFKRSGARARVEMEVINKMQFIRSAKKNKGAPMDLRKELQNAVMDRRGR